MVGKRHILFRIKYPHLLLLIVTFILAYMLFKNKEFLFLRSFVFSLGYFGVFLVGVLFSYGFTAAPATAMLLILGKMHSPIIPAFVASLGAVFGNMLFFYLTRSALSREIREFEKRIEREEVVRDIEHDIPLKYHKFLASLFIGFILASPLPDEIAVSLISVGTKLSPRVFAIFSFILHFIGIFIIISLGKVI